VSDEYTYDLATRIAALQKLNADLRAGAIADTPGDLARLIGRPTEPLAETMKTWL